MSQLFNPEFKSIGESFVQHYYTCYDQGRKPELASLYHDTALLTFEGDQKQGKAEIMTKHMGVTCVTSHAITRTDCQPTLDGGVLVVVLGQLKSVFEEKYFRKTSDSTLQFPEQWTVDQFTKMMMMMVPQLGYIPKLPHMKQVD